MKALSLRLHRGVATNSGLGKGVRDRLKSGPFLCRKYERATKEYNVSSSC